MGEPSLNQHRASRMKTFRRLIDSMVSDAGGRQAGHLRIKVVANSADAGMTQDCRHSDDGCHILRRK